ncbi:hypothetical protein FSS13T_11860 [Flavobacterium saliperosum S13]|uniref:Uncharacterized protein n=1 Tax=Flavobacterium saliperosum S13 TaxID=1341155 RepID=A0ABN0QHY0_9FLAO|nr:hypothetical protein FSS13T_11860 [Flavobacterium saliperosum S13]
MTVVLEESTSFIVMLWEITGLVKNNMVGASSVNIDFITQHIDY